MSGIEFQAVSFRYPTSSEDVLKRLSLRFSPGEVTWLFGPLGAGASTVLLVAAGLAPRHTGGTMDGRVLVMGEPIQDRGKGTAVTEPIGFVSATPRLQLSGIAATVWEEVAFAPANLGWPAARIARAVDQAMQSVGVSHLAAREPQALSEGELQRTVIASMLVLEPRIWLLDEPTAALDIPGRRTVYQILHAAAANGATVVVASEDADALAEIADRLIVLGSGEVVLDGEPMELLSGERIWIDGPGSTTVASLTRDAGRLVGSPQLAMPYPVTLEQAVERWG